MSFENFFNSNLNDNTEENKEQNQPTEKKEEKHKNTIEYENMLEERKGIRESIIESLKKMDFTEEEIKEVLLIIDRNTFVVEIAKQPMVRIKKGENLTETEKRVKNNVQEISYAMLDELRDKIEEIKMRKNND